VQEGQIVTVVDPNTNQPFSVQVPVGLQPGHVFSCATPSAAALPTPPLGSSLKEMLANAGGKLRLELPQDAASCTFGPTGGSTTDAPASTTSVTNSSGTEICIIRVGPNMASGVTLSLPDGSDCQSLSARDPCKLLPNGDWSDFHYCLTGTGGPGGKDFVILRDDQCDCGGMIGCQTSEIEMREGGECVFSLDRSAQLWMCPWLIITGCMGGCCVQCMKCGPEYLVQMKGAECGQVRSLGSCGDCGGHDCCESPMDVITSDPAALHGALLCLCFQQWYRLYGPLPSAG